MAWQPTSTTRPRRRRFRPTGPARFPIRKAASPATSGRSARHRRDEHPGLHERGHGDLGHQQRSLVDLRNEILRDGAGNQRSRADKASRDGWSDRRHDGADGNRRAQRRPGSRHRLPSLDDDDFGQLGRAYSPMRKAASPATSGRSGPPPAGRTSRATRASPHRRRRPTAACR